MYTNPLHFYRSFLRNHRFDDLVRLSVVVAYLFSIGLASRDFYCLRALFLRIYVFRVCENGNYCDKSGIAQIRKSELLRSWSYQNNKCELKFIRRVIILCKLTHLQYLSILNKRMIIWYVSFFTCLMTSQNNFTQISNAFFLQKE